MNLGDLSLPSLEQFTGYGCIIIVALLVITRKLVWHKDLEKAEKRADKWENVALTSLGVADKMTVQAELTNTFLSKIPDPAAEEDVSK